MIESWENVYVVLVSLTDIGISPIGASIHSPLMGCTSSIQITHADLQRFVGDNVAGLTGRATAGGTHWTKVVELPKGGSVSIVAVQPHSTTVHTDRFNA